MWDPFCHLAIETAWILSSQLFPGGDACSVGWGYCSSQCSGGTSDPSKLAPSGGGVFHRLVLPCYMLDSASAATAHSGQGRKPRGSLLVLFRKDEPG